MNGRLFYKLPTFILHMGEILINIHESYRWVVAVCDKNIFGRKLKEGNRVLDLSGEFFNGKEVSEEKASEEIIRCNYEDATFNFAGEKSVSLAKELGLVKDEGVVEVEGVPFALLLL